MPPPPEAPRAPTALLMCGQGSIPCAVLERLVTDAGFEVAISVGHWTEAVEHVARFATDVAIVDLELSGPVGLRVVPIMRAAAPRCQVIVISPLDGVERAAHRTGALAVVRSSDLRPVVAALQQVAASRRTT